MGQTVSAPIIPETGSHGLEYFLSSQQVIGQMVRNGIDMDQVLNPYSFPRIQSEEAAKKEILNNLSKVNLPSHITPKSIQIIKKDYHYGDDESTNVPIYVLQFQITTTVPSILKLHFLCQQLELTSDPLKFTHCLPSLSQPITTTINPCMNQRIEITLPQLFVEFMAFYALCQQLEASAATNNGNNNNSIDLYKIFEIYPNSEYFQQRLHNMQYSAISPPPSQQQQQDSSPKTTTTTTTNVSPLSAITSQNQISYHSAWFSPPKTPLARMLYYQKVPVDRYLEVYQKSKTLSTPFSHIAISIQTLIPTATSFNPPLTSSNGNNNNNNNNTSKTKNSPTNHNDNTHNDNNHNNNSDNNNNDDDNNNNDDEYAIHVNDGTNPYDTISGKRNNNNNTIENTKSTKTNTNQPIQTTLPSIVTEWVAIKVKVHREPFNSSYIQQYNTEQQLVYGEQKKLPLYIPQCALITPCYDSILYKNINNLTIHSYSHHIFLNNDCIELLDLYGFIDNDDVIEYQHQIQQNNNSNDINMIPSSSQSPQQQHQKTTASTIDSNNNNKKIIYKLPTHIEYIHREQIPNDCIICMTSEATHVIYPCRHLVLCQFCSKDLIKKAQIAQNEQFSASTATNDAKCPMCRQQIGLVFNLAARTSSSSSLNDDLYDDEDEDDENNNNYTTSIDNTEIRRNTQADAYFADM